MVSSLFTCLEHHVFYPRLPTTPPFQSCACVFDHFALSHWMNLIPSTKKHVKDSKQIHLWRSCWREELFGAALNCRGDLCTFVLACIPWCVFTFCLTIIWSRIVWFKHCDVRLTVVHGDSVYIMFISLARLYLTYYLFLHVSPLYFPSKDPNLHHNTNDNPYSILGIVRRKSRNKEKNPDSPIP